MTAFDCAVVDSPANALPVAAPRDPILCAPDDPSCTINEGSKRPIYFYNNPSNVEWYGNDNRPGYNAFKNGAQDDIFEEAAQTSR